MVGSRIVLIPVIAAIGYELLRLGARFRSNPVVKVLMSPGLLVQKITTKQPAEDHHRRPRAPRRGGGLYRGGGPGPPPGGGRPPGGPRGAGAGAAPARAR